MPLDNLLNRDILHSLQMNSVLSCYILDGEETDEEERNMCFSYPTPREIAQGLKCIWDSKMGTPSLARIIQDVDLAWKALEIVYRGNGAAVEGIADRNGHRKKEVAKGKVSVGEVHEPKMRVESANSPKRDSFTVICCSCVIRKNGRLLSSSLTPQFL